MVQRLPSVTRVVNAPALQYPITFCRHKSIRAAIERGISHSDHRLPSIRASVKSASHRESTNRRPRLGYRPVSRGCLKERDEAEKSGSTPQRYGVSVISATPKARNYVPDTLPYSSAASEFLYGHQVVLAALKAKRRKFYNLYVHTRGQNHDGQAAITVRARTYGVKIHEVGDEWLRLLDKASSGRPHNGFILETSPLPRPPITELGDSSIVRQTFNVGLDKQSKEDALVNGTRTQYGYQSGGWRHPLVLYVDGVLDEGNLGAIARSAYFLGVDAIATPSRQSAPWSHIALKASAGAAEAIPIFSVNQPSEFLSRSARIGWRIYATDAVPPDMTTPSGTNSDSSPSATDIVFTFPRSNKTFVDHHPISDHPVILMMGSEGTGLRSSLVNHAHYKVGIRAGLNSKAVGVDSLNVSVAASLICFEFLKKPKARESNPGEWLF